MFHKKQLKYAFFKRTFLIIINIYYFLINDSSKLKNNKIQICLEINLQIFLNIITYQKH